MESIRFLPQKLEVYDRIGKDLSAGRSPVLLTGVSPIHAAHLAACFCAARPVVVLTAEESTAEQMRKMLAAFLEREPVFLPQRELVFHNVEGGSRQYEHQRIAAFLALKQGQQPAVMSVTAAAMAAIPPAVLQQAAFTIHQTDTVSPEALTQRLQSCGYRRAVQVEGVGQYSLRGGILDIFPACAQAPCRIEFWDDEIDSMALFDIDSQRRGAAVKELFCPPNGEVLPSFAQGGAEGLAERIADLAAQGNHPDLERNLNRDVERLRNEGFFPALDKYLPLIYDTTACAADYFPQDTLVILCDTPRIRENAQRTSERIAQDLLSLTERGLLPGDLQGYFLDFPDFTRRLSRFSMLRMDTFLTQSEELPPLAMEDLLCKELGSAGLTAMTAELEAYQKDGFGVAILCAGSMRRQATLDMLEEKGIPARITDNLPAPGQIAILEGSLPVGLEYPELRLAILSEGSPAPRKKSAKRRRNKRDTVKSFSDLTPGDIVVHEHHGIGRFVGIETIAVDGAKRDFVKIAFAGTDCLYVPATGLDLISKYIGAGGEDRPVRLNKLGGTEWQKSKAKAKAATKELASKLIALYAQRQKTIGYAFPEDDVWQQEFEAAFPYEETDDQIRCTEEIKADMMSPRPMDRLLCGDVGFGKTEVAMRAIMKCVMSGKQAAILVPTTVLARQHYLTACQRFLGYPIHIEVISRFRSQKEEGNIYRRLKNGDIDLLIGTHKLFSKAIQFKDLGLLVIDEEQRFGVTHKEKLKEMSKNVDVLTLSATPIPRTLNMALSGIRDLSIIEQPPQNRHPVQTYVLEYDMGIIVDALRREYYRGGQSYYLHNNVESIERTAMALKKELPEAVIQVAHGKMSQRELNRTMNQMSDGEIDILVCTTIIETGIDIPNANTLIVENADHMGLSQLHQLRGRVGRSTRHAFAYFTYRRGKALSEVSQKRLSAVREFAEFGSGFKIAMRDLEIRGAGNLLGPEQSGHLLNIGYDLYLKLLEEAVLEEKGEKTVSATECQIEIPVNANLPESYVSDAGQRVDLYRRIALIRCDEDMQDMLDEMIDRYGEPPKAALALCKIALLRAKAAQNDITEIKQDGQRVLFTFEKGNFARFAVVCGLPGYKGRLLLNAGQPPYLSLRMNKDETTLDVCFALLDAYQKAGEEEPVS